MMCGHLGFLHVCFFFYVTCNICNVLDHVGCFLAEETNEDVIVLYYEILDPKETEQQYKKSLLKQ